MGAIFQVTTAEGRLDQTAVIANFQQIRELDLLANGHSYSGGFGMATGLIFTGLEFVDADTANEWLEHNCRKWEEALAVRYLAGDATRWMIGAVCSW